MDGAWALYEAWLRLQEGDIEIAVVTGSGRSSTGDPALIYPMEMDPYYLAPLGVDPVTFAALQARAVIAAGIADERSMAEVALRSRRSAIGNEFAQVQGDGDIDTLLAEDYVREPLRRHDLPPITDGAVAVVLATAERAQTAPRPTRPGSPGSTTAPSATIPCTGSSTMRRRSGSPGRRPGSTAGDVEVAELQTAFTHEELLLRRVLELGDQVVVNASGGPLASNPIMASGLARIGYAADHIFGEGRRALAHATSGPCLQQNLICILEGDS